MSEFEILKLEKTTLVVNKSNGIINNLTSDNQMQQLYDAQAKIIRSVAIYNSILIVTEEDCKRSYDFLEYIDGTIHLANKLKVTTKQRIAVGSRSYVIVDMSEKTFYFADVQKHNLLKGTLPELEGNVVYVHNRLIMGKYLPMITSSKSLILFDVVKRETIKCFVNAFSGRMIELIDQGDQIALLTDKGVSVFDFKKNQMILKHYVQNAVQIAFTNSMNILVLVSEYFKSIIYLLNCNLDTFLNIYQDRVEVKKIYNTSFENIFMFWSSSIYFEQRSFSIDVNSLRVKRLFLGDTDFSFPGFVKAKIFQKNGRGIPLVQYSSIKEVANKTTVIYLHSKLHEHSQYEYNTTIFNFLMAGIDVLSINYQGSTGFGLDYYQENFNKARKDVETVMSNLDALGINKNRLVLFGSDYGGALALSVISDSDFDLKGILILNPTFCGKRLCCSKKGENFDTVKSYTHKLKHLRVPLLLALQDEDIPRFSSLTGKKVFLPKNKNIHSLFYSKKIPESINDLRIKAAGFIKEIQILIQFEPNDNVKLKESFQVLSNKSSIKLISSQQKRKVVYNSGPELRRFFRLISTNISITNLIGKMKNEFKSVSERDVRIVLYQLSFDGLIQVNDSLSNEEKIKYYQLHNPVSVNNFQKNKDWLTSSGISADSFMENIMQKCKMVTGYYEYNELTKRYMIESMLCTTNSHNNESYGNFGSCT